MADIETFPNTKAPDAARQCLGCGRFSAAFRNVANRIRLVYHPR